MTESATDLATVDRGRLVELIKRERSLYRANFPRSWQAYEAGANHLLGGVPMTWMRMWSGGYPIFHAAASGARLIDLDGNEFIDWLAGGFFQHVDRRYGQTLPTPGYDALVGVPSSAFNAPADTPFFSDLSYRLKQYAAFGEATWHISNQWALTGGLRYYKFNAERAFV